LDGTLMLGKLWYLPVIFVLACAPVGGVSAAELVMFESDICEWCEKWHEEVGVIYAKTDEARLAPLRRVDIYDPVPEDLKHLKAAHYTPTFVLMQDGKEVGRILGYPGEDFFWGLLAEELNKLKPEAAGVRQNAGVAGCADKTEQEKVHETTGGLAAVC
jgi:hypothetical protein